MKILLSGATGLLGREIWNQLENNYEIIPLSLSGKNNTIACDIRDESKVSKLVEDICPDLIIHSAAITDVDLCEKNQNLAHEVNTIATRNLVWNAGRFHSAFIYISTDYVFSGEAKNPYPEDYEPVPINVYGITKLGGEKYVSYFMEEYFILRTGLLYGPAKINFVQNVVEKLREGKEVLAAVDQIMSSAFTIDFAKGLDRFLTQIVKVSAKEENHRYGVYHLVNAGFCSRYDLTFEIAKILKLDTGKIKAVKLEEIPKLAPRPRYSALSSRRFEEFTGYKLRPWPDALKEYLLEFMR